MLETGAVVAVVAQEQLVATPSVRVQEPAAPEKHRPLQDLFQPTPAVVVAEVGPVAIRQRHLDLVVTAVAEMAQRPPTPLQRVSR